MWQDAATAHGGQLPGEGTVPSEDWAEICDPRWRPAFEQARNGLVVTFTGACPRCSHPMTFDVARATPPGRGGTVRGAELFTMWCLCGHAHPGHPDGDNSCGAYWQYEAELFS
jgi:hypothetical protein